MFQKAFTITQGGADTAAETILATGIQPGVTFGAWALAGIEINLSPNLVKAWAAADADLTIQFMKRSLAGSIARVVTYGDTDLIASINMACILSGTAANLLVVDTTLFYTVPPGTIIYAENVYAHLISTGTGATNIAWGRILYELRTLSQSEALAVVASRP